jgi:hypothetical protein
MGSIHDPHFLAQPRRRVHAPKAFKSDKHKKLAQREDFT